MKTTVVIISALMMLSLDCTAAFSATAQSNQPPRSEQRHRDEPQSQVTRSKPKVGSRVVTVPSNRVRFTYKNKPYYFHQGVVYYLVNRQYEVVDLVEGMIIPELPRGELREITLGKKIYYEHYDVIYRPVNTRNGVEYEVVGWIN